MQRRRGSELETANAKRKRRHGPGLRRRHSRRHRPQTPLRRAREVFVLGNHPFQRRMRMGIKIRRSLLRGILERVFGAGFV